MAGASLRGFRVRRCLPFGLGLGRQAFLERLVGRPSIHGPALVGPLAVKGLQEGVEVRLHLVDRFVPLGVALGAEALVQQGPVQALDEAVAVGGSAPASRDALFPPVAGIFRRGAGPDSQQRGFKSGYSCNPW